MAKYLDQDGLGRLVERLKEELAGKQDKLAGTAGQLVGFDADGNAAAVEGGGGVSKEYVDGLVGDIGAILDSINGEVV